MNVDQILIFVTALALMSPVVYFCVIQPAMHVFQSNGKKAKLKNYIEKEGPAIRLNEGVFSHIGDSFLYVSESDEIFYFHYDTNFALTRAQLSSVENYKVFLGGGYIGSKTGGVLENDILDAYDPLQPEDLYVDFEICDGRKCNSFRFYAFEKSGASAFGESFHSIVNRLTEMLNKIHIGANKPMHATSA